MEREALVRPLNLDTILIVRTDRDLHAALHGAARREGTTASALVRKAVAAIVATDGPPLTPAPDAPAAAMPMAA
jgi:voltage-gated potassium channel Kch